MKIVFQRLKKIQEKKKTKVKDYLKYVCKLPLRSLCILPPPPKNMLNMSIGEDPPPIPPSFIACSPPWSYKSLFFGSDSTSYAWDICLNCRNRKKILICKNGNNWGNLDKQIAEEDPRKVKEFY